jgi:large subunit ribosomal protein L24
MVKSGDMVRVIAGKDKSKVGVVKKVLRKESCGSFRFKVVVEGVNIIKKRVKKTNDSAGRIEEKEAYIDISNVMILDDNGDVSRISIEFDDSGKKYRVFSTTKKRIKDNFIKK